MGVTGEAVMLDCPDAVETQLFRQQRLLDHIVEDLLFALAREVHHLRFIDNREFHLPLFPQVGVNIAENFGNVLSVNIFLGLIYRPSAEKKKKMIVLYG
jgi:hypothetical protein